MRLSSRCWHCSCCPPGFQVPAQQKFRLLLGDTDSVTAIEAARRLKADPALAGTRIHVYPLRDFSSRDLSGLRRSRVVLVDTVGMGLAHCPRAGDASIAAQGGKVFAVGPTWDKQIEALGMKRDAGLAAYVAAGGASNIVNMVKQALKQQLASRLRFRRRRRCRRLAHSSWIAAKSLNVSMPIATPIRV